MNDYIETGMKIDGLVSSEFLTNIFIPNTPMHDGAVIIRGNRVMAAGCLLPLTEDRTLNKELGTRHRAAIGMTEQTDSVVVVVSEETGTISYVYGGRLTRYLDSEML
ncbi:MAG: disA 2 [Anaerospora sp.]|nr:disA 2 [Anaerospora sp.]